MGNNTLTNFSKDWFWESFGMRHDYDKPIYDLEEVIPGVWYEVIDDYEILPEPSEVRIERAKQTMRNIASGPNPILEIMKKHDDCWTGANLPVPFISKGDK